ncbi:conserved Plasmodium protein, unknown function [Plasmodium relictum]|uniref:Uncharacterized protein n=1 Tax=Plasmodium relictum TaxID=85471 RepID=A0A1J1HD64_PLARL|nr:conserved Plasmodium protein, unknown function [Plasmodium relictum]CRH03022.1 conserved Plasmodium protein, unknown function [Plasmodium relictum]
MMGMNHDFLSGNFVGYPLEENTLLSHRDFNLKKYKINPLKNNIFNNYGDSSKELDDLREYKRITTQKIKRYESTIYSYKNQIRNLKKDMFHGEVNIQLISVFVNAICDIIEYLCSDINKTVLSTLPFIHTILNSISLRDKQIYHCSKLIHATLTQINNENKINNNEKIIQEEENKIYQFSSHKLQDLEWLASETNDKGWLAVGDRWELCKRDLKWLCVETNNRSWLLYRNVWENSSNDLKYLSVLFDDKKWLNLYNIWNFVPLSLKLRAISLKDPHICKPSLNEIMLKDDDIYKINILELNSDISNILKRNYLKYKSNDKMNDFSLRNTFHQHDYSIDENENELLTEYGKIKKRENILEKSLKYNLCTIEEENIPKGNENGLVLKFLPRKLIKDGNTSKHMEKEKVNSLKKEPFTKVLKKIPILALKNENNNNNGIKKSINIPIKPPVKHEENYINKKNPIINKINKNIIDNKSIIPKVVENLQEKKIKLELSEEGFDTKQNILKEIPKNTAIKSLVNKQIMEKNKNEHIETKEFLKQNSNKEIQENKIMNNKEQKLNNDKKEKDIVNKIKQKCIVPEKKILNNLKKENMSIKLPQSGLNLLKKKETEQKSEYTTKKNIPTKMAAPLSILPKIKEENLKKSAAVLKSNFSKENILGINKNNDFHENESDNILNEKSINNKNGNTIPKVTTPTKIVPPINNLSKIKEKNAKKVPAILKKTFPKENMLELNKNGNTQINESNSILHECDDENKNIVNITDNLPNINSCDLKTIKRKESVLRTHAFINNEKEIKINVSQKIEDPKKESQNVVTNYFTDLFNAFNFVTKKDEDDEISNENKHIEVEKDEDDEISNEDKHIEVEKDENEEKKNEEDSYKEEKKNPLKEKNYLKSENKDSNKEGICLKDKENLKKEENKSEEGKKDINDEKNNSIKEEKCLKDKEYLKKEENKLEEEKKDIKNEKKNSMKEEKYLKKKSSDSKLKKKYKKEKKKDLREKGHDLRKKETYSEEKEIDQLEEEKDSRRKKKDSEKKVRDLEGEKKHIGEKGKYSKEEEKGSKEKIKNLENKEYIKGKEEYLNELKKDLKEVEDLKKEIKDLEKIEKDLKEKKKNSKEKGDLDKKKNDSKEEKNSEKKDLEEKKKENEEIVKKEISDDSNEKKMKLKSIKSIRNINSNKYSIKINLKSYSNKGILLKTENTLDSENETDTKYSEKKLEYKNRKISLDIEKERKNETLDEICVESKTNYPKNKSILLEKPSAKFTKNKPSSILQKLLDSDLSDFDSSSKKMTADEIAKHTNASLQISVKRKASLSSIKVKSKLMQKPKPLFNL